MPEDKTTVLAITGSIAAGKSSVVAEFQKHGAATLDCDKVVASLYENDAEMLAVFKAKFPEAIENNKISKQLIKEKIMGTPKFKELEGVVHSAVRKKAAEFVAANQGKLIVIEIQMLFESGAINQPEYAIDYTVVVDAPYEQRFERSKASRPWLTPEHFKTMNEKQMSPEEKKAKADFVIENSDGANPENQVRSIIEKTMVNGCNKAK